MPEFFMTDVAAGASEAFVLLDDASADTSADTSADSDPATAGLRRSRLYTGLRTTLDFFAGDSSEDFFAAIERELSAGGHAAGFFSYEFGAELQRLPVRRDSPAPLATVLFFRQCEHLSSDEVARWLAAQAGDAPYAIEQILPSVQEAAFSHAVEEIRRYIEAGDTYQLNFTFPVRFRARGNTIALYAALRQRQPVPYGALAALPDGSQVLSLSPELFVSHRQGRLCCKPMKGTARAHGDTALDASAGRALAHSTKERAENLMIVDLLRNDLGRIAQTGSVSVRDLFAVERFGSVLQMTSTIDALVQPGTGLADCFTALYPCGSITGAPKRRSMQLLSALERAPRGLYTGAIGWFDPPAGAARIGDFTLSVPIRTLHLSSPDLHDARDGVMGVGAGITYDSDAQAEYQECLLKAAFLTGMPPGFSLFETMHGTRSEIRHLERHLARLYSSARHFGFRVDDADLRRQLAQACESLSEAGEFRLRLTLFADGRFELRHARLPPLPTTVKLLLSPQPMRSDDVFLSHKTSLRQGYDRGWQAAEAAGAFDTLFCNERGELTEGGRSNLFIRLAGRWYTPPLSAGLLPGVMRAVMLDDKALNASERSLSVADLRAAEEIVVCNALRGRLRAEVVWETTPRSPVSQTPP